MNETRVWDFLPVPIDHTLLLPKTSLLYDGLFSEFVPPAFTQISPLPHPQKLHYSPSVSVPGSISSVMSC